MPILGTVAEEIQGPATWMFNLDGNVAAWDSAWGGVVSTARAVDQRRRGSVEQIHRATAAVAVGLEPHTSWRLVEHQVREDAADPETWWRDWAETHHSRMRKGSIPYAITWRWIHEARGALATSPGWSSPTTQEQRAAYRQFEAAASVAMTGPTAAEPRREPACWRPADPAGPEKSVSRGRTNREEIRL